MTTEIFINKDVSKTDETFHNKCILNAENKISILILTIKLNSR